MAGKGKKYLDIFIKQMGTSGGTIVTFSAILGTGFGAGVWGNNLVKNNEIIEINSNHFIEISGFTSEIETLKSEIRGLEFDKKVLETKNEDLKNKITEYERKSKK